MAQGVKRKPIDNKNIDTAIRILLPSVIILFFMLFIAEEYLVVPLMITLIGVLVLIVALCLIKLIRKACQ